MCPIVILSADLWPVYTKHQRQFYNNSAMTIVILFPWKMIESLQSGIATHFQADPFFSIITVFLESLHSCRSVDSDTRCKHSPTVYFALEVHLFVTYLQGKYPKLVTHTCTGSTDKRRRRVHSPGNSTEVR